MWCSVHNFIFQELDLVAGKAVGFWTTVLKFVGIFTLFEKVAQWAKVEANIFFSVQIVVNFLKNKLSKSSLKELQLGKTICFFHI